MANQMVVIHLESSSYRIAMIQIHCNPKYHHQIVKLMGCNLWLTATDTNSHLVRKFLYDLLRENKMKAKIISKVGVHTGPMKETWKDCSDDNLKLRMNQNTLKNRIRARIKTALMLIVLIFILKFPHLTIIRIQTYFLSTPPIITIKEGICSYR